MQRHLTAQLLALGAVLLGPAAAWAQQESVPDLDRPLSADPAVVVGRLENGIRYYVRENPEPQDRAELRLVVRAGSVLEDEDQLGLAHFVEHMAFNGTEHFAKQELVDYLEGVGMRFGPDLNAYTSFDETVYMLKIPTDSAEIVATAFQILEDWAHGQVFDPEEIEKERGVVIEEWRSGQGAMARMQEIQLPILFKGSRYAERLPIGEKEVLESFDHSAPQRFYREWYRPGLMAVIAVGDFHAPEIERRIRDHFGRISPAQDASRLPSYPMPDHDETLFAIATDEEATFSSVSIFWKQPLQEENTVRGYRQSIVELLFNQMLNQRLFELTQQADPPFLGASSGQGRFIGASEVYVLSAGVPEDGIVRGLETLLAEAARVDRHGFTEPELERARRELLRGMKQAYDEREKTNSSAYANEYVRAFLWDEPFPGIAAEYEWHQALLPGIRLEEVNRLAREWITDENRVVMVNAPKKEGLHVPGEGELRSSFEAVDALDIGPYEDVDSDAPLVAQPPAAAEIVEEEYREDVGVHRWTLANGVRVLLKPTAFKDDEILFQAWSPGGTSLAPNADYIPASTAATVVGQGGLGAFDLVELGKRLSGVAVNVRAFIADLGEGLSGSASPSDVETMFELIYLHFTAPRRDPEAFQSYRSRLQAFLANRSADPEAAFRDTITVTLAQYHPRARPPAQELYEEMDLDRSFEFYRDRFADAGDFSFAFVGSFDPAELRPLIRTYLGGLPSIGREESWRDVGIEPPVGVIEKEVYRGIEPKSQTRIIFTGRFEWTRENRYLVRALGDVLRIRLREVLREDLSGTYGVGVSSDVDRDPRPSYSFRIGFGSAPQRVEELTAVVFDQIEQLKRDGPKPAELRKVKEIHRREYETDLRENSFWLAQLVASERYGTDPGNILSYDRLFERLTGTAVREAAERYLLADNYVKVSLYPETAGSNERP